MRKTLLFGAAALFGMIATDPAFCMQDTMPMTPSTATEQPISPDNPSAPLEGDMSQPQPPVTQPMPPEMPPAAGEARQVPPAPEAPMTTRTDAPVGPMATPPAAGGQQAVSGGTTSAMMTPQPATKAYPLCSRTIQDSCRNPGEGPKAVKRTRR